MEVSEVRLQAFGRPCRLVVDDSQGRGAELLARCRDELTRLDRKFSCYQPESIVSRLNDCAGTGTCLSPDPEEQSLFRFVRVLWSQSKQQFDPTIRVLQACYDKRGHLRASREQLRDMLQLVGLSRLEQSEKGLHLSRQGMRLDLNSCVRPYAVDSLRRMLEAADVGFAMIEVGQDVATIGKQPGGANWLIGVRLPTGASVAITRLKLNDRAFAMRGEFERASHSAGERFGRALSPVDGHPVPGLLSVAVTADSCLEACSAASLARLKTEAAALAWLSSLGLPWLAVDRELQCHGPLAPQRP